MMRKFLMIFIGVIVAAGISFSLVNAFGKDIVKTDFSDIDGKGTFEVKEDAVRTICTTMSNDITMTVHGKGIDFYSLKGEELVSYADEDNCDHELIDSYKTISDFFKNYNDKRYIVIAAVAGDGWLGFDENDDKGMRDSGLSVTPLDGRYAFSYLAVKRGSKVYFEKTKPEAMFFDKDIKGHHFYARSAGDTAGSTARITIDEKSYCAGNRGINLLAYDHKKGLVVDCAWIDRDFSDTLHRDYNLIDIEHEYVFGEKFDYVAGKARDMGILVIRTFFVVIAILLLIFGLKAIYFCTNKAYEFEGKKWVSRVRFFTLFLYVVITAAIAIGYYYLSSNFTNVSISQLLYHMNTDLTGTNWSDFKPLFIKIGIGLGGAIILIFLLYVLYRLGKKKLPKVGFILICVCGRMLIIMGCIGVLIYQFHSFYNEFSLYDYLLSQSLSTNIYEKYYADGRTTDITFPEKKKNLITIYVESMETTPASTDVGGGKKIDYIPELSKLALDNTCFNGTTNTLNGAYALGNTGWTIAGMIAESSGIPLNTEVTGTVGNDYKSDSYLPGAYSIGEILADNGYNNFIMMGSDVSFAGRGDYYSQHGNYLVYDYNWARTVGKIPADYYEWWGYEDKKLFEYAKEQLTKVSDYDKPFNFTILTADTHFSGGYVCEDCILDYDTQYYDVLACTSRKVNEFIEWVKKQDFYKDTVIAISGDHLYMEGRVYADAPAGYERKVYFNVINSDKKQPDIPREYTTFDIFPTTLSALGCKIDGNRLGLGTDLYSDTETITEIMGKKQFDIELQWNSTFYDRNILYAKQ